MYCFLFPVVIPAFSASKTSVLSMLINVGNIVSLILRTLSLIYKSGHAFVFIFYSFTNIYKEWFGTISFKAWKHLFLTILRPSILLLTAAIILSRSLKEALRRIFWHDFCRSSEFELNERLNFKGKPFGYVQLLSYFPKKIRDGYILQSCFRF